MPILFSNRSTYKCRSETQGSGQCDKYVCEYTGDCWSHGSESDLLWADKAENKGNGLMTEF